MAENMETPPVDETPKDNKKLIIIIAVVVVLCCCCVIAIGGGSWLWQNGDSLFGL